MPFQNAQIETQIERQEPSTSLNGPFMRQGPDTPPTFRTTDGPFMRQGPDTPPTFRPTDGPKMRQGPDRPPTFGPTGGPLLKLATLLEPKVLPIGFVRANRAIEVCEFKGRELVTEAMKGIRIARTNLARETEEAAVMKCRDILDEAEELCTLKIEEIMER